MDKGLRASKGDLVRVGLVTLLSSTPIAFMTFDFFLPNMSTPSLAKNLLAIFLLSVLAGMPAGFFIERPSLGMVTVISYTSLGYALSVLLYSMPSSVYEAEIAIPGLYYAAFFRWTIILLFFYVLAGFMGVVFGSMIHTSMKREETGFAFSEPEKK